MARKLKVFYGHYHGQVVSPDGIPYRRCNLIIATTSQKKAAEAAQTSVGHVRDYWSETGNDRHVRLAMQHPEKLILMEDRYTDHAIVIDIVDNISEVWGRKPRDDNS